MVPPLKPLGPALTPGPALGRTVGALPETPLHPTLHCPFDLNLTNNGSPLDPPSPIAGPTLGPNFGLPPAPDTGSHKSGPTSGPILDPPDSGSAAGVAPELRNLKLEVSAAQGSGLSLCSAKCCGNGLGSDANKRKKRSLRTVSFVHTRCVVRCAQAQTNGDCASGDDEALVDVHSDAVRDACSVRQFLCLSLCSGLVS